jgi:TRAP transporter TAXI family solute receptor
MKRLLFCSLMFTVFLLVSRVLAQTPTEPLDLGIKTLTIASGPVGGAWYPLGAKLGEVIEKGLKIKVTVDIGGSAENVRRVNAGKDADMGLASTPEVWNAYHGYAPFNKIHSNISLIGYTYTIQYQVLARKNSGIRNWKDVSGKRISPGKAGLGGEILTRSVLEEYGLSYEKIRASGGSVEFRGYSEATESMKDGNIDLIAVTSVYPFPSFEEYLLTHEGTFINLDMDVAKKIIGRDPAYNLAEVPANTYKGQDSKISTIGYGSVIIVRSDLPEHAVYPITKCIFKNEKEIQQLYPTLKREFSLKNALLWSKIPVHPGAKRFYVEAGVLKN